MYRGAQNDVLKLVSQQWKDPTPITVKFDCTYITIYLFLYLFITMLLQRIYSYMNEFVIMKTEQELSKIEGNGKRFFFQRQ